MLSCGVGYGYIYLFVGVDIQFFWTHLIEERYSCCVHTQAFVSSMVVSGALVNMSV